MYLICFDISDDKRLRKVAREMENFGLRVQRSIFECHLDDDELMELQKRMARIIEADKDSIRYYSLCNKDINTICIDGPGKVSLDPRYTLI
ncbi:CRISPR-associated endonuclease Cas2 [Desulforhopalus vacuolatus]|uniref:CRISPR-associated endonuclease Cas2 n=1 Tax=Desulforhopalus vacuolatus TaxID=40414 RepID=UPI001964E9C2|nr:CRISPR-associated endonuclease Cas2 [Desulforhopalus vacuolatus]MBM9521279.1 CRISPR-associated endonuclease Cas2 [Desulforhopalus vacuolatus]